jgi:hypothetical protein
VTSPLAPASEILTGLVCPMEPTSPPAPWFLVDTLPDAETFAIVAT